MVSDFEELAIYQQSRELAKKVYQITREGEFKFDSRFVQQMRAASGSISDNIAEGFERQGNKEFLQFLYIAKGSCGELRSQINRAYDVGYITESELDSVKQKINLTCVMIHNLIESIKKSEMKGSKYNTEPH
jgi:four helix bundle protein